MYQDSFFLNWWGALSTALGPNKLSKMSKSIVLVGHSREELEPDWIFNKLRKYSLNYPLKYKDFKYVHASN